MSHRFNVVNPPRKRELSEYQSQIDEFVDWYQRVPGVTCIATMGSIKAPGYSDIDFVLFVDESFNRKSALKLSHRQSFRDSGLVLHAPVILGPHYLAEVWRLLYISNLTALTGSIPASFLGEPPSSYSAFAALSLLIDFNETRLLQYSSTESTQVLDRRYWSTVLWSLTHSVLLTETAGVNLSAQALQVVDEIRTDRQRFCSHGELSSDEEFCALYEKSRLVTEEIFNSSLELERRMLSESDETVETVETVELAFRIGNKTIVCQHSDVEYDVAAIRLGTRSLPYSTRAKMPAAYGRHLAAYGFAPLGKRSTVPPQLSDSAYRQFLKLRYQAALRHYEFNKSKGLLFANGPCLGLPLCYPVNTKYILSSIAHRVRDKMSVIK